MPADTGLAKTHILENCDLPTLLEPAPAHAVQVGGRHSKFSMCPAHARYRICVLC